MGAAPLSRRPRVVIDTNCLVSALVFESRHLAWLRRAWIDGGVRPLGSRATVQELIRVLAYAKFALTADERAELLGDYLPFVETVAVPSQVSNLPIPRDPADLPFLLLARHARADALVTGDGDLLALRTGFDIPILKPAEFRARLDLPL